MIETQWLGLQPYHEVLQLQNELSQKAATQAGFVLGLEHPEIITLGWRADESQEIDPECKMPRVKIERGGYATIHSPGQLVIYPIINLKKNSLSPTVFIEMCLMATVQTLKAFGLETSVGHSRVGVYCQNQKIAFCGFRIKQGVTMHGISINISNDLSLFEKIRICGSTQESLTSMQQKMKIAPSLKEFFDLWTQLFFKDLIKDQALTLSWSNNAKARSECWGRI